jgi:DNA-binding transcriptional MerR regulator
MYTIGKLAQLAGVTADTVRFYERQGLVAPATKNESGYRLYTDGALRRIAFIKHAQCCGFSLAEIDVVLRARERGAASSPDVYRLALRKKEEIEDTIVKLRAMLPALAELIESRSAEQTVSAAV